MMEATTFLIFLRRSSKPNIPSSRACIFVGVAGGFCVFVFLHVCICVSLVCMELHHISLARVRAPHH